MSGGVTNTILATENQDWGFWGTIREHAAVVWPIAFTAIHNATSTDPDRFDSPGIGGEREPYA